jgi:glucose-1-phosphate thymidylyltransferase
MKVIIPVAGLGTRLRPHTHTKPKPLVTVAGKPVLGHILDKLVGLDVEEIVFITGYLGDQIERYVTETYDFKASFVEQKELKGQAHAISLARERIDAPVLIIFVDTIFEADLGQLADLPSDGVIYVKEVPDPRRFGVVTLNHAGLITRFVEKPDTPVSNLAVIGVYYLKDWRLLYDCIDELIERDIQTKGEYFLADALQLMVNRGARLNAWTVDVWEDCGTPDAVLHTNRYLLEHGQAPPLLSPSGRGAGGEGGTEAIDSHIIPPVYIHPTARVVKSIIGPYVSIAADCQVINAIVRDSILDEGATIEHTMLDQSLIGKKAIVRGRYRKLNVGDSSAVDFSEI